MSSSNRVEILRTKLYRPRLPERLLKLGRLLKQLENGLDRKITIVTAPAGYGKTMLVSSWLSNEIHPACWISLDTSDDNLYIFLSYLIAAVQTLFPESCKETTSLLGTLDPPPLSILQTCLVNELDLLPERIIVVLDDFHLLLCPEIHSFISNLVNHMPFNLHLVVNSRERPPLPLAVWRARQQINEIGVKDLCFTQHEAKQFLKSLPGNSFTSETIRILCQKAEGWITGLQLAAYSFRHTKVPENFVDSFQKHGTQDIREFLLDQAFLCQPIPIQQFLLKTSILDRFSAPLCNALGLCGENLRSTQDTLNILKRTSLFIVPLDEQGEWFRFHNLFAEMLQRRLKNEFQAEAISDLHRRVMEWFKEHELIDEAIQHALGAGNETLAVEIIEQYIFDALNQEKNAVIDRWLAALPDILVETRPRLLMVRAWIESYRSGKNLSYLKKAQAMLDSPQTNIDPETRLLLEGYVSALWPLHLINTEEYEAGIKLGEHALKILPQNHYYVRGRALMGWTLCMLVIGRGSEAVSFLLSEKNSHPEVNAYTLVILQQLACIYVMKGKLEELEQTASSLYSRAKEHEFLILTGWGDYMLGLAAYIKSDLDTARLHFENAASMKYLISKAIVRESLIGLCLVSQAMGREDEAQTALERLNELEFDEINEYQCSLQARLALSRNGFTSAQFWSMANPVSLPLNLLIWLEMPHFTQAHIWVASANEENLQKAVHLLTNLKKISEKTGSLWRVIESEIWLACALYRQGKFEAALDQLEQAVQHAQPRCFAQIFIEAGPLIAEMLKKIVSRQSDFVRQILAAFESPHKESGSLSLLTERELEVLQLLNKHLSGNEIALKLSISPDTVKKHCYHIYNKLGVNRRRDAIFIAKETGILQ